jgi:hypothetical protein
MEKKIRRRGEGRERGVNQAREDKDRKEEADVME